MEDNEKLRQEVKEIRKIVDSIAYLRISDLQKEVLSLDQACEFANYTPKKIKKLVADGFIKEYVFTNQLIYSRVEIQKYFERYKYKIVK